MGCASDGPMNRPRVELLRYEGQAGEGFEFRDPPAVASRQGRRINLEPEGRLVVPPCPGPASTW